MTPILIKDNVGSITIFLENSADGTPATGLLFSGVTSDLKKAGGAFASHTLTGSNFTELSAGFYEIDLAAADVDTLGNLHLRVQGATIRTALTVSFVAVSVPATPSTVTPPGTVAIFGYLYGPDAAPVVSGAVRAKILGAPTVLHPGDDGLAISQELVTGKTDSDGFFTLDLIAGTSVDFSIPAANYRRTFLVPSTSANVFDIP